MPILCKPLQPPVYFLLQGQLFFLPGNESVLLGTFFLCVYKSTWLRKYSEIQTGLNSSCSDATIKIFSKHLPWLFEHSFVIYADVLVCQFSTSAFVTISSELLDTFLFLLTSLNAPMSQSLLSLVDFACFQSSGNYSQGSISIAVVGYKIDISQIPSDTTNKFWGEFTFKIKSSNIKFKQISWTNFPWSVCSANSNTMFSNFGD